MNNKMSRVATHVYVNQAKEAVEAYKNAFALESKNEPQLADDGALIYQELRLDGQLFMSITDYKFLDAEIRNAYPDNTSAGVMLNIVYLSQTADLKRAFETLHQEGRPSTGIRYNETESKSIISSDVVFTDKFGVLWHLCVLEDWDSPLLP